MHIQWWRPPDDCITECAVTCMLQLSEHAPSATHLGPEANIQTHTPPQHRYCIPGNPRASGPCRMRLTMCIYRHNWCADTGSSTGMVEIDNTGDRQHAPLRRGRIGMPTGPCVHPQTQASATRTVAGLCYCGVGHGPQDGCTQWSTT
jgi:hypothetical protein